MKLFVTGATGYLGRELVRELLERGHEVTALVRRPLSSTHANLKYVVGDVTKHNLGVEHHLEQTDALIHAAAITTLKPRDESALVKTNLEGTINVVRFCLANYIQRLFYVSTLYISGDYTGTFKESDYDLGQVFKNPYEQSKFNAEGIVRNHNLLDVTVFRPGILVGRYEDGHSTLFEGFYRPMRAIVAAHDFAERRLKLPRREVLESALHLPVLHLPIRIYGAPESTIALTPVDFAASSIASLISSGCESRTYHIVPDKLPELHTIAEAICEVLGIEGYHVNLKHTRNPLDAFYNRLLRDFLPYLHDHPSFQTSVGASCPSVDKEYIKRLIAYWRVHDESAQVAEPQEVA